MTYRLCGLIMILLTLSVPVYADDLEIFGGGTLTNVEPNVLLIYDNSGSMGSQPSNPEAGDNRSKLQIARDVLLDLVTNTDDVRFGLMAFNPSGSRQGGVMFLPCGARKSDLQTWIAKIANDGNYNGSTGTPLAESLAEAGLYFAGTPSWYSYNYYGGAKSSVLKDGTSLEWYTSDGSGGYTYVSPIEDSCQQNSIILMTDGEPNSDGDGQGASSNGDNQLGSEIYLEDTNSLNTNINYANGSYLDEISHYLWNNDVRPGWGTANFPNQFVKTYTIGFDIASVAGLLTQTATDGADGYFPATSYSDLQQAFNTILARIEETNAIYVPPVIPRNPDNQTDAGNRIYLAFFKTQNNKRWLGNLKAFKLVGNQILDANDNLATDVNGYIKDTARSLWSSVADGLQVDAGGVGENLVGRTNRNIYAYLNDKALTNPNNAIKTLTNYTQFPPAKINATSNAERDEIINLVRNESSAWPLGDIIHSVPFVQDFANDVNGDGVIDPATEVDTYVFVGANDGMLHVFDASLANDGIEAWAYIPREHLPRVRLFKDNPTEHHYFVDGSPLIETVNISGAPTKVLIFGSRRGGKSYTALDVTSPLSPDWLFEIDEPILKLLDWNNDSSLDNELLGQSWAQPQFKRVLDSGALKDVFLLAGGYDTNQDADTPAAKDSVGRAIYTVNAATGAVVGLNINSGNWLDGGGVANNVMTHSILDVLGFDATNSGYMNRVYAGDLGGHVFAARYNLANDNWNEKLVLMDLPAQFPSTAINVGQKFMTRPEATLEVDGECIYIGTGDREHLTDTSKTDAFYVMCNKWQDDGLGNLQGLTLSDLVDISTNLVQDGTDAEKIATNTSLNSGSGWYLRLPNLGEKVMSSPKVLNGKIYFTTFTPGSTSVSLDPCDPTFDFGVARLYILDYRTGGAAFDLNNDGNLTKEDRSTTIGTSVPSDPVLTTSGEETTVWTGAGAGDKVRLTGTSVENNPVMRRYFWRQLK